VSGAGSPGETQKQLDQSWHSLLQLQVINLRLLCLSFRIMLRKPLPRVHKIFLRRVADLKWFFSDLNLTWKQRWAIGPIVRSSDIDSIFRLYRPTQSVDFKFQFLYRAIVSVRFKQCSGSGSARIRNYLALNDPDPDPKLLISDPDLAPDPDPPLFHTKLKNMFLKCTKRWTYSS